MRPVNCTFHVYEYQVTATDNGLKQPVKFRPLPQEGEKKFT